MGQPGGNKDRARADIDTARRSFLRGQSPHQFIIRHERGGQCTISFSYRRGAEEILHDGRLVHLDYPEGNTLTVDGRTFRLFSAHLHTPSDHQVDGSGFAAELHLVHTDDDDVLAVVGQLFKSGDPSPVVQEILDAAPQVGGAVVEEGAVNAAEYMPDELDYYRTTGPGPLLPVTNRSSRT